MKAVLDRARLKLVAPDRVRAEAMLALFFTVAEEKLALLADSSGSRAMTSWREVVHFLKGSAANLGMQALAERCRQAERCLPSLREKTQWIEAIAGELQRVRQAASDFA